MSTTIDTIDTSTSTRDDRRKRRIIGVAALATAGALVLGLGYAYFSDSALGEGSATAGTLDLTGALTVDHTTGLATDQWTATDVSPTGAVPNLNPGDLVRISGDLTNAGNKSAWIRAEVTGTADPAIAPYLYVYAGETVPTQGQVLASADPTSLPGYLGTITELAAGKATTPLVIAGTGANAEATAAESTTAAAGAYDANVVVYFDKAAANAAQNKPFSVDVDVQAVQYRNNTDAAAVDWTTVDEGTIASGTWAQN